MFQTLRGGTQELADALAARLGPLARTGVGVTGLALAADSGMYHITLSDGTALPADAVVLATPAPVSARLLAEVAPELAQLLAAIRHVESATVSLGYRLAELPALPTGFGFVVAAGEPVTLRAATLSSVKFDQRAPAGYLLLRAFVGGDGRAADLAVDDAALVASVRADLARVLGVHAEPVLTRVFRWPAANPQYDVGHLSRVAAIEAACPPGLYLTGAAYHGVGVPDCVRSAEAVAQLALAAAK
jgi:oxygen-dependent protoporphyrinogen oxidase